jgi:hypothetical protein
LCDASVLCVGIAPLAPIHERERKRAREEREGSRCFVGFTYDYFVCCTAITV